MRQANLLPCSGQSVMRLPYIMRQTLRNSSLRALRSFSNPICTRRSSLAVCSAFLCVVRAAVTSVLARLRSAFTAASVRHRISLYTKASSSFAGGSGLACSARGSTGT